jgi:hypothetical protein
MSVSAVLRKLAAPSLDGWRGGFADLHQSCFASAGGKSAGGEGREQGFRWCSPKVVDDDVKTPCGVFPAKGFRQGFTRLIERDGGVGSENGKRGEGIRVSPGGDHPRCAKHLCNLYRELSGDAGRSKYQHRFARDQLGAMAERKPGRNAGIRNCRRGGVVEVVRDRKALRAADHGALGERAMGPAGSTIEDASPVGEAANAVGPGDHGKFARACEVSARRRVVCRWV